MYKGITVNLMVPSVSEALGFYRDLLGFAVVHSVPPSGEPGFAILRAGGAQLMLQSVASMREDIATLASKAIGSSAVCFTEVDDVDDLWKRLQGKVDVVHALRDTAYGMREFYVRDPYGYVFGFAQRVS